MEFHFETRYRYIIAGNEKRIYDEKRKKRKEEAERRKREMEQRILALSASMESLTSESKAHHIYVAPHTEESAEEEETNKQLSQVGMTSEKAEQIKTSLKEAAERDMNFSKRNMSASTTQEEVEARRKRVEHMNILNLKKHSL